MTVPVLNINVKDTQMNSSTRGECQPDAEISVDKSSMGEKAEPDGGVKIVIDNVDKNVVPRYMSSEKQTQSLHYVQMYAVHGRTDISQLSDDTPVRSPTLTTDDVVKTILPSPSDNDAMADYFSTSISRALVTHLPFFNHTSADVVQWHIPHAFTEEMSKKSEVVSIIISLCTLVTR